MKDMGGGGGGKLYLTEAAAVWVHYPCTYINTDLWKTWGGGGGKLCLTEEAAVWG